MKNKRRGLRVLCLAVLAVCLFQIGREYCQSARNRTQMEKLNVADASGGCPARAEA